MQPTRFRASARLLYIVPLPLLIAGIIDLSSGDAIGMAADFAAFGLLILTAILVNEGLKAEQAYNDRSVARPPAIPRKLFGLATTAAGVFVANAFTGGADILGGIIFAVVAVVAQFLAFGLDPMRAKGTEGASAFETDRVARVIDNAEETVSEILEAAKGFRDRQLEGRVERMLGTVRDVFRTVEQDPRDLTRARKFLGVYLTGARDATRKFADLYGRNRDPAARAEYVALLDDMEASFTKHRQDLLENDKTALDVEIEVLRERLQREGV